MQLWHSVLGHNAQRGSAGPIHPLPAFLWLMLCSNELPGKSKQPVGSEPFIETEYELVSFLEI